MSVKSAEEPLRAMLLRQPGIVSSREAHMTGVQLRSRVKLLPLYTAAQCY